MPHQKKTQGDRFKVAAHELGCDEDEKTFDDKLRRIGKAPPPKADNEDKTQDK